MTRCRPVLVLIALLLLARLAAAQSPGESRHVEIDGHAMHLSIAGAGPITVVLEAGGGFSLSQWDKVQPALAQFARVVSYDRPGLGKSVKCEKPETAQRVATELHAALQLAGVLPPYLLVAHSMGGPFARVFTR
ncbi:MAG TPA: alpha/beta hydrolase, partial [Gemmatimonadaceae bacterium]